MFLFCDGKDMQKKLWYVFGVFALSLVLFLWWCTMDKKTDGVEKKDFSVCKEAVQEYLATTNTDVQDLQAKKGDAVVVDYVGRFESGEVFDTSVETVAKKCWAYQTGRDYSKHLPFQVGAGQMIAGFDAAVEGMKLGATTTITLAPKDAYGEKNEKLIFTLEKSKIKDADSYTVWQVLSDQMGRSMKIIAITDDAITFDANPPMAGKTLIFDITLLTIK